MSKFFSYLITKLYYLLYIKGKTEIETDCLFLIVTQINPKTVIIVIDSE